MNSLDKLTIRGFKSIKNLEQLELKALNVFIGANGAGKNSLISFFKMLRSIIDGNLNGYVSDSGGASNLFFNGLKTTEQMEFEIRFERFSYRFKLKPTSGDACTILEEDWLYPGQTGGEKLGSSGNDQSLFVGETTKDNSDNSWYSKPVYDAISSWQIYHFHDTSETAGMRRYEIIQNNKFLRADAANIAPFLAGLREKHPREYKEIFNAVKLVLPFFEDFLLDTKNFGPEVKTNLSWKQKGADYPMQPYHLSDGSIRFICLATALLQPKPPATIIIDEPELGLHPLAIAILAELIQDAAKRTQVIITTQSPALIDQFAIEEIIVVNRENGSSTFKRLAEKDFNVWLEDYSVGELWSKNVISAGPVYE